MARIGSDQLARRRSRRLGKASRRPQMAIDILDDDDGIVDDQADRQNHGKQGEQIEAEPRRSMIGTPPPTSESGMVTTGISTERQERRGKGR